MFTSILSKTLYEKRWFTLGWTIAIALMVILIVVLFPTFKESFGVALKDVPESMKAFLGSAEDYQTIAGYVNLQVVAQMVFMTIIMAVILFTSLLAGDETNGTLQSLLYQPVSRGRVYLHKLIAGMLITAIACVGLGLGILLGVALIHEHIDLGKLAQTTLAVWLITMVFGALAYAAGACIGRRGATGAIAGIIAFATYTLTSLATTADSLEKLNYLSPFRYFNSPNVLQHGLDAAHTAVLGGLIVVLLLIGYLIFIKRDIYQR
jgi:ABC-2 type transport system permease protein